MINRTIVRFFRDPTLSPIVKVYVTICAIVIAIETLLMIWSPR